MPRLFFFALISLLPLQALSFQLFSTEQGRNLRWRQEEVTVVLDDSLSLLGPRDMVEKKIIGTFDLWLKHTGVLLRFEFKRGDCSMLSSTGHGCVMAFEDRSSLCHRGEDRGASTYLRYSPSDGRIKGFTLAFNAADFVFSVGPGQEAGRGPETPIGRTSDRCLDLTKVVAHEVGHILGVDHSLDPESVMYPTIGAEGGSEVRLAQDDIAAIGLLYVREGEDSVSDRKPTKVGPASSAAPRGSSGEGAFPLMIAALSLGIMFRGRRGNP